MACRQHGLLWLSLTIRSYRSLLLADSLDDECKYLLVGRHWCVHVQLSRGECSWWVFSYFTNSSQYVLLGWFVRWEVSGRTTAVLLGAVSSICWKHPASFFCSSRLVFSLSISQEFRHCNRTVVPTRLQTRRISVLFYQRSDFHIVDNPSWEISAFSVHNLTSFSVNEILLPRLMNGFLFN